MSATRKRHTHRLANTAGAERRIDFEPKIPMATTLLV
jgi:hypothetical protein